MRVKQIINVDGFYKALAKCKGRVELITDDRDVLNLSIYIDTVYRAYDGIQ